MKILNKKSEVKNRNKIFFSLKSTKVFWKLYNKIHKKFRPRKVQIHFRLDEKPLLFVRRSFRFSQKLYLHRRLVRFFYSGLTAKGRWKISRFLRRKKKVTNESTIASLEFRLLNLLLKCNLFSKHVKHEILFLIRHGKILVNGKPICFENYMLKPYDIVSLRSDLVNKYRKKLFLYLSKTRKYDVGLGVVPEYLEVSFRLFGFCYIPNIFKKFMLHFSIPLKRELVFNLGKKHI